MKFLNIFKFAYLIFAIIFFYDFLLTYQADLIKSLTSLFLALLAIFIFFFRKKFQKRFNKKDN
mgnify:CR=1 FL=1|jgi:hypothetical protein